MIKKQLKLVITFHTTTEAMAMEKACKELGTDGRIIPVPTSITAGCGLAWCAKPESKEHLKNLMENQGILYQEIRECLV